MNIGLTGGISTGKSTVSQILLNKGATVIDADLIAREVVLPGSPVLARIAERFGQQVIADDGSLHRKQLGQIIFNDEQARKALEEIMHPSIRELIRTRMTESELKRPKTLVVVDIPLLYESKLQSMFEEVMVVYVPHELQLKRLMERDKLSEEDAIKRLAAQLPIEEKKLLADIVIDNSGTMAQTRLKIDEFWQKRGLSWL